MVQSLKSSKTRAELDDTVFDLVTSQEQSTTDIRFTLVRKWRHWWWVSQDNVLQSLNRLCRAKTISYRGRTRATVWLREN